MPATGATIGHAGVHQREAAAADRGHGGRAVGGHDLRGDADGVGEHILGRNDRQEGALGERAVADFAAAGAGGAAGLADRERREVVVEDEALGAGAAGEGVEFLRLLGGPERGEDQRLGVAALEDGGAVHAGQHADLAGERADRGGIAPVGARALVEDGLAVGLVLEVLEHDRNVVLLEFALAELGEQGGLGFDLEGVDVGLADLFFLAKDGVGHFGTGHALDDGAGLGLGGHEIEDGLGFAGDAIIDDGSH